MAYTDFIPQNVATQGARRIGIYNAQGNRVGQIPLGNLAMKNTGRKFYSFMAISDIHIGESTAADDYNRCLIWANDNVDFVVECGDLIHGGTDAADAQIEQYKMCRANATIPVYSVAGNHDGAYVSDIETAITTYTGQPLYYTFERGDDVFVMIGNVSSTAGALFTAAELTWLADTLEANKDKRVFLMQHVRPDDACGNALGIYTYDIWSGAEQTTFENLLRKYPNVIFFHGHSHLKFYLQQFSDLANIDKTFGCWSVHVPSISVPRDTLSVVDPSITTVYAQSEGYVVDVYENGIHLRGRDFVKGEFLPIASYWLDTITTPIEVAVLDRAILDRVILA